MRLEISNYINYLWLTNVLDPIAPTLAPTLFHNMQAHWNLPHYFNPLQNMQILYQLPFFVPQELKNPTLLHAWQPNPQHFPAPMDIHQGPQQPHPNAPKLGEQEMVEKGQNIQPLAIMPFTEISSLREVKIMLFQAIEDKKYVCKCPMELYKCSLTSGLH